MNNNTHERIFCHQFHSFGNLLLSHTKERSQRQFQNINWILFYNTKKIAYTFTFLPLIYQKEKNKNIILFIIKTSSIA